MADYIFEPPDVPGIPVKGESALYPVGRIFCVGRNYAAHAAEMGVEVDREAPFYFTKSPSAFLFSGGTLPYPPGTENFHHEMELALAIGAPAFRVTPDEAAGAIYAYGCALDMTRRDLQLKARERQRPWDLGKDVEGSAVFAALTKAGEIPALGPQRIHLEVNGEVKQDATLDQLIHSVPEIVADLSKFYHLRPGDLIMTGTPAGVGPVVAGDRITGGIDGLADIALSIGEPE
ncbi:MAG: fumarylacetoacetate hydrolase family protein [Rhodosalinus sp.]|uniref:fumarylacetoacetate hydrolase family protein n=1 Tax=Rhodosalinus sp. TaxID=2047741 RepID=UPI0039798867